MNRKYCGPICLVIDDDQRRATFSINRSTRAADQLGSGSMSRIADWVLCTSLEIGYTVDTTEIDHLLSNGGSVGL